MPVGMAKSSDRKLFCAILICYFQSGGRIAKGGHSNGLSGTGKQKLLNTLPRLGINYFNGWFNIKDGRMVTSTMSSGLHQLLWLF